MTQADYQHLFHPFTIHCYYDNLEECIEEYFKIKRQFPNEDIRFKTHWAKDILAGFTTSALAEELKKREGVESYCVSVDEEKDFHVEGYATVFVVVD